jgi:hypothetical protein
MDNLHATEVQVLWVVSVARKMSDATTWHDKTLDHLLLQCPFSRAIWFRLLQRRGWTTVHGIDRSEFVGSMVDIFDGAPASVFAQARSVA